jgi:isopropylmalate/homocitrate/citramalate synthase
VIEHAVMGVKLARRKHVEDVEFSAEDAFRTEREFLVEVFEAAIAAGARTSTCRTPWAMPRRKKSASCSATCAPT